MKNSGLRTPEHGRSLATLAANREPGLIYAHAEPDRIMASSRSGFFGLDLDTLIRLNANGAFSLPRLLPMFSYAHY